MLHGTLRDASTGEPVSRATVWLHFFCDDIGVQKTLDPDAATTYEVTLPQPTVRVRAYDRERTYALYETTFTAATADVTHDIALQPTGYVLLRATVIDARTGMRIGRRPAGTFEGKPPVGGHGPLFYFHCKGASAHTGTVSPDTDGTFALKVPRGVIEISVVDTAKRLLTDRLDLTGCEGATYDATIELE